jgi:hypothetical protein
VLVLSASHLHGQTIAEHDFADEYREIVDVLRSMPTLLRPSSPFGDSPRIPKRQISGSKFRLFPVDQKAMNAYLDEEFRGLGWELRPLAAPASVGAEQEAWLRGDFGRHRVFIEVEFGNSASMYRDLFKFQVANRSNIADVGVLVLGTRRFAGLWDQNVAHFEDAVNRIPFMAIGVQCPIWIVGFEPDDFAPLRDRYNEMQAVAEANQLTCHAFREVEEQHLPMPNPEDE